MSVRVLIAALVAAATLQSQPTFRSGVDLIRLDVSVVDKTGQPVSTLLPEDFSVRIDGTVRKVSFVRFYGAPTPPVAAAGPDAPAAFFTNVSRMPGRVVVFVVDLESIKPGAEKLVLETAGKLLDGLGPSDSAGLIPLPGKSVDLTRDHARVRTALTSLRGFAPRSDHRRTLSPGEAEAFERGDRLTISDVVERECRPGEVECRRELADIAKQILVEANRRILSVLPTLTAVNAALQNIEAPKSVVLLSGGLAFTEQGRSRFVDLQQRSAESGVMTYVVQLEQPEGDAGNRRTAAGTSSRSDMMLGLQNIAGATDGDFFAGVGKAVGVFDRIETAIGHSYQLGIEALPQDADGRRHRIDVQVKRSGLTVKTRKELSISSTKRPPRTPVDVLALPTDVEETAIAASAYSFRGEETSTLKVILLLELLGHTASEPAPTYAISITQGDRVVFETADELTPSSSGGARAVVATQLAPGKYRLRTAALDSSGRAGSLDTPFGVGLRQAGEFQFSDLLLGTSAEQFTPATHLQSGTPLTAMLELYTADPLLFADVNVELELRKGTDVAVVGRGTAHVMETAQDRRRVAEGRLTLDRLDPGLYSLSAIIRKGAVPVGKVTRTVAITTP